MERNISALKFGIESTLPTAQASSRCSTCGAEFEKPLLAMVSSGFLIEEYYACPKCLSKVGSFERPKNVEVDEVEEEKEEEFPEMTVADTAEETEACAHHLGYLKRRPKNTPIPEECLTCSKMIDCMSQ